MVLNFMYTIVTKFDRVISNFIKTKSKVKKISITLSSFVQFDIFMFKNESVTVSQIFGIFEQ